MSGAQPTAMDIGKALGGRWTSTTRQWSACCPAHDDKTPSLTVKDGDSGRVLVKCHSGCSQAAVITALQHRGLWADAPMPERTNGAGKVHGPGVIAT